MQPVLNKAVPTFDEDEPFDEDAPFDEPLDEVGPFDKAYDRRDTRYVTALSVLRSCIYIAAF